MQFAGRCHRFVRLFSSGVWIICSDFLDNTAHFYSEPITHASTMPSLNTTLIQEFQKAESPPKLLHKTLKQMYQDLRLGSGVLLSALIIRQPKEKE